MSDRPNQQRSTAVGLLQAIGFVVALPLAFAIGLGIVALFFANEPSAPSRNGPAQHIPAAVDREP